MTRTNLTGVWKEIKWMSLPKNFSRKSFWLICQFLNQAKSLAILSLWDIRSRQAALGRDFLKARCQFLIELLREPYRIDRIAGRTDIQTGPQPRPGYYLLRQHDRRAPPWLGVRDVTDRNLRDTDASTVTGRERMWRDPKRRDLSESSLFIGQRRNKKRFPCANLFSVLYNTVVE